MWNQTAVAELLGTRYPLLQAAIGKAAGPELAAAVSEAGGLGTIAAAHLSAERLREAVRAVRARTGRTFAVHLHIAPPPEEPDPARFDEFRRFLLPAYRELGLGEPVTLEAARAEAKRLAARPEEQLAAVAEERVPVLSFSRGILDNRWIDQLKRNGTLLIGTATTVSEGAHLEHQGIDLVVGQGSEAAGERGTFLGSPEQAAVGTMALTPLLADTLHVPVVASGGVMDGRGIAAALLLGAGGVQLGSAFLACPESRTTRRVRDIVLASMEESTVLSRAYRGRPERVVRNRFVVEGAAWENLLPPEPFAELLTRPIREAAQEQERAEYMAVRTGQASRLLQSEQPAAAVVERLARETGEAIERLRER